jgi:RHS repeat-associated protein
LSLAAHGQAQLTGTPAIAAISRETRPRSDSRIGSVDTGTGAFTYGMETLTVPGFRTLDFPLQYNSILFNTDGPFGPGWTHPYDMVLGATATFPPAGSTVTVFYGLGINNRFRYVAVDRELEPIDEAARYDQLVQRADGTWRLVRLDGNAFHFDRNRILTQITNAANQSVTFERVSTRITAINGEGKKLFLTYKDPNTSSRIVETVSDEASRVVHFVYDTNHRLAAVRGPALMDGEGNEYPISDRSVTLGTTFVTIATVSLTRTTPAGFVRFMSEKIEMNRPRSFLPNQPAGPVTVVLRSPQGTDFELPGDTVSFEAGTNDIIRWTPDVHFIAAFAATSPSGSWQIRARIAQNSDSFRLTGASLRFSEPADETRFTYDPAGRLVGAVAPDGGQLFRNTYDSAGRIATQDDGLAANRLAQFSFVESGSEIRTTYKDRLGNDWLFVHDNQYRLRRRTDPLGNSATFDYDSAGNRTRVTDPLGRITEFGYDSRGRLTNVSRFDDGNRRINFLTMTYLSDIYNYVWRIRDALGNQSEFTNFNAGGNPSAVIDALGNRDDRQYGGAGQLLMIRLADGGELKYDYHNGLVVRTHHPSEPATSIGTVFDRVGRMVSSTGADGAGDTYTYNARLQLLTHTDPAGTTSNTYDSRGRQTSKGDRQGNVTGYTYDGNGNLLTESTAAGVVLYEYDGEDRRIAVTDTDGNKTTTQYDAAGRVVAITDPEGIVTRFEYDAAGNVIAERDGENRLLGRTVYDYRNLPVISIDALGNETRYTYDDAGRLTEIRDPLGRIARRSYDRLDRLVEVREVRPGQADRVVRQEYTSDDRVWRLYDHRAILANRPLAEFTYDPANRLTSVETPYGELNLRYTKADQVSRETTRGGRLREYEYDTKGNLTRATATLTTAAGTVTSPEVLNEYDPDGNLIRVSTREAGRTLPGLIRSFDTTNRITRFTDAGGNTLRYSYDDAGNLRRLTYPDGKNLEYAYDRKGRLTRIQDWAGRITRYTWSADGITRIQFPNGTTRSMEYDRGGRIARRTDRSSAGAIIVDFRYSYDAAGQLGVENTAAPPAPVSIAAAVMTYDQGNRLATYNGTAVTFDADANLTRGPLRGSFANFVYDPRNNLTAAGSLRYSYDPEDRLVAIASGSSVTSLVVNPAPAVSQVVVSTAANGTVTRYIWGIGLVYEETGTGIRVYHYDQRGSTVAFSDSSGQVTGTVAYEPFGKITARTGDADSLFLFGGLFGVITDENGLAYMRYRWYSPEIARFLNQDSQFGDIAVPSSLNQFSYAGNHPVLRADPEGRFWHILAGAAIGAAVAVLAQAVSDISTGKFSGFERYGAVALGGAVGGAIAAACGGILCAGLAGAAEEFVGSVALQGLRGETIDFEEAGQAALVGAAGGLAGGALGKAGGRAFAKLGGKSSQWTLQEAFEVAPKVLPAAYAKTVLRRTLAREFVETVGTKVVLEGAKSIADAAGLMSPLPVAAEAPRINATAKYAIEGRGRLGVNKTRIGVYGENVHWKRYQDSLRLAGRPLLTNSNNILAVF